MSLRKLRWAILAYVAFDLFFGGICGGFLPLTPLAAAQFTTVSGTVIDPNGLPYANGTISAVLNSSTSPTLGGLPYQPPTQPTGLNSAGKFVMNLADNTQLLPGGTTWTFITCSAAGTVQPAGGKGPVCFTVAALSISGASQDISTQLQAAALSLANAVSVATTINSIPGALLASASGQQLMFIAQPAADPHGSWIWFGADIGVANIGLFNYDMVVEDLNNPVGQRNIKFQARDDVGSPLHPFSAE